MHDHGNHAILLVDVLGRLGCFRVLRPAPTSVISCDCQKSLITILICFPRLTTSGRELSTASTSATMFWGGTLPVGLWMALKNRIRAGGQGSTCDRKLGFHLVGIGAVQMVRVSQPPPKT